MMTFDADPRALLRSWPVRISDRKLRLFACACWRRAVSQWWEFSAVPTHVAHPPLNLDERTQHAVEVAERLAEGACSEQERLDAYREADDVLPPTRFGNWAFEECARDCLAAQLGPLMLWDTYRPGMWRLYPEGVFEEVFGHPGSAASFDRRWRTSTALGLADSIYAEKAFDRMPILADALEDAGCDDARILNHCRQDRWHVRGCWVLDLILGKE